MTTLPSRVISITIHCPWETACAFLAEPLNFPRWASGLAEGLEPSGDVWQARTAGGGALIRFSPANAFGIADHSVYLPSGDIVQVPLRAIANGPATDVQLTLFRQPGMSDEQFGHDARWVEKDLAALKALLEEAAASSPH